MPKTLNTLNRPGVEVTLSSPRRPLHTLAESMLLRCLGGEFRRETMLREVQRITQLLPGLAVIATIPTRTQDVADASGKSLTVLVNPLTETNRYLIVDINIQGLDPRFLVNVEGNIAKEPEDDSSYTILSKVFPTRYIERHPPLAIRDPQVSDILLARNTANALESLVTSTEIASI